MNLLCGDKELNYLKRLFAEIEETTRILKRSNDEITGAPQGELLKPEDRLPAPVVAHPYKLTHLTLRECFRPWLRKDYDKEW